MNLHDLEQHDFETVISQSSELGESIVYLPNGGSARTIQAVVNRGAIKELPGGGRSYSCEVRVSNDAVLGISTGEVDYGRDKIRMAWPKHGNDTQDRTFKYVKQSPAVLVVEVS